MHGRTRTTGMLARRGNCYRWPQPTQAHNSTRRAPKVNTPSTQGKTFPLFHYYHSSSPPMNHQDISRDLTIYYFFPFYAGPVLSARSRSAMRSSTSSIPTEIRTRSSVRPRSSRTEAGIAAWDMKHGRLMRDFTLPECKKGNGNSRSRVQLGQMVKASLLEGIEFVWDAHRS